MTIDIVLFENNYIVLTYQAQYRPFLLNNEEVISPRHSLPSFCQVFLVLLARVAALPVGERLPAATESCASCSSLAIEIQNTAAALRNIQLCEYFRFCEGDWSSLLAHDFALPQIRAQDRCLRNVFHKETCLKAIASGLQKYKPLLLLVETYIMTSNNQVTWMRSTTQRLAELVMNQINAEFGSIDLGESDMEVSASEPVSSTDWDRQVKVHVVLRDFTKFIEKAARAIRFMAAV
ncbi:interleukin-6-like [Scyliorhinus canicula]|uniref:interleukin-6-like n=1 Tax=Scyliorhinus canicula TaxID=7830 RepID=UPI0018F3BA75|nr:interleukin-6-like [Scyliorhinus canicula]